MPVKAPLQSSLLSQVSRGGTWESEFLPDAQVSLLLLKIVVTRKKRTFSSWSLVENTWKMWFEFDEKMEIYKNFTNFNITSLVSFSEKAMAPHSSTLAWKIPWTEEPSRLQSMGSLRVGRDWATSLFTFMHWRRKWQTSPVFLPGESQGRESLVGCRLWGHTESDRTEVT